ncbi:unnamed protein product [Rangifer tarandus platyrhynchus]|uniref:Uncharacterized protein n=2 Tax=Rangifer tarandus platyrhynchus TaxID=3082113 RepID=A0AC59Z6L0_RANTA|nr:unnamed protein product [Rangifer tarandus platyrhynchus]
MDELFTSLVYGSVSNRSYRRNMLLACEVLADISIRSSGSMFQKLQTTSVEPAAHGAGCRSWWDPPFTTLICLKPLFKPGSSFSHLTPSAKLPRGHRLPAAFVWTGGAALLPPVALLSASWAFPVGVPQAHFCPRHTARSLRAAHAGHRLPDVQCQRSSLTAALPAARLASGSPVTSTQLSGERGSKHLPKECSRTGVNGDCESKGKNSRMPESRPC